ncbi:response regulator transcription factor [Helicovermis profundi]|uniref:Stage 0 sporulation protein A homolog n=1 Tax=Helicovermis profundi TaxID=3065157 RepID=A0AAU9EQZ6_9FIRM|nr:response regulator [Clostridia bacterium S502]
MYRILIADDEELEREGLKKIISKNFKNMFSFELAENGREAIEIAYKFKPDIVFMDMKMPGIEGIEAIEEIKKISISSKFVIISAYDSFYYAQKALNIDVKEYLLKPVKREKITKVINNLIDNKKKEESRIKKEIELKEKLNELLPFIENELVQSLMLNDSYKTDIIKNLRLLDFNGTKGYSVVFEIYYDDLENIKDQYQRNIVKHRVEETIRRVMKENFDCLISKVIMNRIVVFIELDEDRKDDNYFIRTQIVEYSRRLRSILKEKTNVRVSIGIGSIYDDVNMFYQSYKEALIAVKVKTISAKAVHFEDINIANTYKDNYPIELERDLIEKIHLGNIKEIKTFYNDIINWILIQNINNERKKIYLYELKAIIDRKLSEKLGTKYKMFNDVLDGRDDYNSLNELRKKLWNHIRESVLELNKIREDNFDNAVLESKKYIEKNYHKEITLDDVAERMAFSSYYFSKLFKQQTGVNFIDFLTKVRIDKSKQLLKETDLSMKYIANKIGYRDANYFSRVFKKNIGMNPSEYRNINTKSM